MRTLNAWIENHRVGAITEWPRADGSTLYAFEYEEVTSKNIVSLTMVPIEGELRFESLTFPSSFDMVLSKGERRVRIEEARKIVRTDPLEVRSKRSMVLMELSHSLPAGCGP